MQPSPPIILTIAGSDSSAGAGIQADLKTISALGGYGLSAITSVVSETPGHVSAIRLMEPGIIEDQIRILLETFPVGAVKMGMLGGSAQILSVVKQWKASSAAGLPLVVDPVMVATGGGRLLEEDAISHLVNALIPLARIITPNMDEAQVLSGDVLRSRDDLAACAEKLGRRYGVSVLIKGGHLADHEDASDVLWDAGSLHWFTAPRSLGVHTHGTGCAYSAAIATGLARGLGLHEAVNEAKQFISRAISTHFTWLGNKGTIHALNHFHSS
jgi:hydroxymethylpyrimidine/phosphomethylpyrimidine kinase